MAKRPGILLAIVFAVLVAVGALQGARVQHLRQSDTFYRWIISASTQMRFQESLEGSVDLPEGREAMDKELFDAISAVAERELPPLDSGQATDLPRLIQYSIAPDTFRIAQRRGVDIVVPDEREQRRRTRALWRLARSNAMAEQRQAFQDYLRAGELVSVGSQFDIQTLYGGQDTVVSLGNLFFGFRKMAANLLWLEADKLWHKGQYYRMLPIMKTTVALDPTFVDAFLIGAWHLAYNATAQLEDTDLELREYSRELGERVGAKEEFYYRGIEFLKDGIRKNPDSYRLYFDLGFSIYGEKLEDWENSVKYLTIAYSKEHDTWVPRMLFRAMRLNEQYEEALAGYEHYLENVDPDNPNVPRLMEYCKAGIQEKAAADATEAYRAAEEEATSLAEEAQALEQQGDVQAAAELRRRADALEARAATLRSEANAHREEARRIYQGIVDMEGSDPLAEGKLLEMQARDLVQEGRYKEAIALLQYARFESDELFFPLSDLIIDIKLMSGEALSLTERDALKRRELEEAVADRVVAERTFEYRDVGWYQEQYAGQSTELLSPDSSVLNALTAANPDLEDVLDLASLAERYPDADEMLREGNHPLGLGDRVVFRVGEDWFEYVQ